MKTDPEIEMWARMSRELNGSPIFENEEEGFDWGSVIGTFTVTGQSLNEMGSVGKIDYPHQFVVYVHPDEGMIPHFHVFDKEGRNKKKPTDAGIHTCVEIRQNKYFKHGPYADDLDKDTRIALDKFMRAIRQSPKYQSDVGFSNFVHTVNQWDDNNAVEGTSNWVSPDIRQPDYKTLIDNM